MILVVNTEKHSRLKFQVKLGTVSLEKLLRRSVKRILLPKNPIGLGGGGWFEDVVFVKGSM